MLVKSRGLRGLRGLRGPAALAVAGLALAGLSGCGVTGTDVRPGIAAEVGNTQISQSEVDDTVTDACAYFATQHEQGVPVLPRSFVRAQVFTVMVQEAVVRELVEESGADLNEAYDNALAQVDATYADLPADQQEALTRVDSAFAYVTYGQLAAALAINEEEGGLALSQEAAVAYGEELTGERLLEDDVEINPVYGVEVSDDGSLVIADTSLAEAVSEEARTSVLPASDDEQFLTKVEPLVAQLPESQRC